MSLAEVVVDVQPGDGPGDAFARLVSRNATTAAIFITRELSF
jgi:hypothetical protein